MEQSGIQRRMEIVIEIHTFSFRKTFENAVGKMSPIPLKPTYVFRVVLESKFVLSGFCRVKCGGLTNHRITWNRSHFTFWQDQIAGISSSEKNVNSYNCKSMYMKTNHNSGIIMSEMASQITGVSIVFPIVCSGTYQRKHQSSASLVFVREIHRSPVGSLHKGLVTGKIFPFDDVIIW